MVYSEHTPVEQKQHKKQSNNQWRLLSTRPSSCTTPQKLTMYVILTCLARKDIITDYNSNLGRVQSVDAHHVSNFKKRYFWKRMEHSEMYNYIAFCE